MNAIEEKRVKCKEVPAEPPKVERFQPCLSRHDDKNSKQCRKEKAVRSLTNESSRASFLEGRRDADARNEEKQVHEKVIQKKDKEAEGIRPRIRDSVQYRIADRWFIHVSNSLPGKAQCCMERSQRKHD